MAKMLLDITSHGNAEQTIEWNPFIADLILDINDIIRQGWFDIKGRPLSASAYTMYVPR